MKIKTFFRTIILVGCLTMGLQPANGQTRFKILTYNILYGLQKDSLIQDRYTDWVKKIAPDILACQEMNYFTQKSMEKFAARYGHDYAVISKEDGFPTALSSGYPIVNVRKVVDNMWHAYIYARIRDIHVFVIHFSPHSLTKRRAEVKEILAHAALIPENEKIVIMGDFNSLSGDDAPFYSRKYLELRQKSETENAHIRNLDQGKLDFSVIQSLKDAGFKDAYRLFHSNFTVSCPTKKYSENQTEGSRIDFMWLNPTMAKYAVRAEYIYDADTDMMSDHYPLLVEFEF
ncbi:MAG: endonuclease/exonuclease/phosphatase family protein [Dysgonamonadaceae bacterium]|jgi:exodeoxyribonuclease-3|nr:endonuclease/exonuclease/phosphatase family protein [Dysgonamonadaceae bacterium]